MLNQQTRPLRYFRRQRLQRKSSSDNTKAEAAALPLSSCEISMDVETLNNLSGMCVGILFQCKMLERMKVHKQQSTSISDDEWCIESIHCTLIAKHLLYNAVHAGQS